MSDVKIELLEVHFDVVGDDEQTFVRLFEKYINRWTRMQRDDDKRRAALDSDRLVADPPLRGDA
ncbi:MAG TPA: hypothetical protein VGG28_30750 [Kofleriaceae bacterium]|jgi:hypothetical protein